MDLSQEEIKIINMLFDNAFELEHKIQAIELNNLTYDYKFKDIHELIENRDVLIYTHYDSSWRNKEVNCFIRYSYC